MSLIDADRARPANYTPGWNNFGIGNKIEIGGYTVHPKHPLINIHTPNDEQM